MRFADYLEKVLRYRAHAIQMECYYSFNIELDEDRIGATHLISVPLSVCSLFNIV